MVSFTSILGVCANETTGVELIADGGWMFSTVAGPIVRCPSESRTNGITWSGPTGAFDGIDRVSRIATESGSGLENPLESDITKLPVVLNPTIRTLTAERALIDITIDLPMTAIVPEAGLP